MELFSTSSNCTVSQLTAAKGASLLVSGRVFQKAEGNPAHALERREGN